MNRTLFTKTFIDAMERGKLPCEIVVTLTETVLPQKELHEVQKVFHKILIKLISPYIKIHAVLVITEGKQEGTILKDWDFPWMLPYDKMTFYDLFTGLYIK